MEAEIKTLLDGLRSDWAEFQRTNAERIRQEAKGVVDPLVTEKLATLNAAIDQKQETANRLHGELQAKVNRLELAGAASEAKGGIVLTDEQKEYKKALLTYVRSGRMAGLAELEEKAMSVQSNPDGGYWVTPDLNGRMVTRQYETSDIRPIASIQTIGTDSLEGTADIGEADAAWVAEAGARTATTTPQIGQWKIFVHELYANPGATQKLLDDASVDVEAWLANKVADKFSRLENAAFVVGDGVGKPRGFASYTTAATADSSRAWGTLEHVLSGTASTFGTDPNGVTKLMDLLNAFKPKYIPRFRWVMNRTTRGKARQLTDASSAGKFVFMPSFIAGVPDSLLGYPVTIAADMVSYTVNGGLGIAAGDFQEGYQIVDRTGIRVLRDPFTNKPYVHFYTTKRVGGDVVDFEAIKFMKFS